MWVESRHRVLSIPRWGLVINVYVSLILIPVASPGGSELPVRQQGLFWGWHVLRQRQVCRGGILAHCVVVFHHHLGVKEIF